VVIRPQGIPEKQRRADLMRRVGLVVVLMALVQAALTRVGSGPRPSSTEPQTAAPRPPPTKVERASGAHPPCVEPLSPGKPGVCFFHSQSARTCRQDQFVFKRLGGKINEASCAPEPDFCVKSKFSQEVLRCECVAPPDPATFGQHFLEIGAADGLYLSNSAFFEFQMGWRGVCIEASPLTFKELARNRPSAHIVNAVVGNELDGKTTTFFSFDKKNSWEVGMSGAKGATGPLRDERTASEYAHRVGASLIIDEVPGVRLSDVFRKANITRVAWASIDVEGHEVQVLDTWDAGDPVVDLISTEGRSQVVQQRLVGQWGMRSVGGPLIDSWFESPPN